MTYLTCPNCGTSLAGADVDQAIRACPSCCASLQKSETIGWQRRPPPLASDGHRRVQMTLAADRAAPGSARGALASACDGVVDAEVLAVAALLTSELVTNAVTHSAAIDGANAHLNVWLSPTCLRVEVADNGDGFRPEPRVRDQDLGSGWGLHLVEEMASGWGVTIGVGTHVWFDLELAAQPAGAL